MNRSVYFELNITYFYHKRPKMFAKEGFTKLFIACVKNLNNLQKNIVVKQKCRILIYKKQPKQHIFA